MLLTVEETNVNSLFYKTIKDHDLHGEIQHIRGTTRKEIQNYMFRLHTPAQNMLFIPYRYTNPPAIIAETLWVLAGRDDMWFLKYYLKNAVKYSDDGLVWRGAYGPRLCNYPTKDDEGRGVIVNQIDRLLSYMRRDRLTTRGMLVIPDGRDYQLNEDGEEKIDEPCTIFVQYMHRESTLNCTVNMRSNDIVLGCFNVNLFEWTYLQQLIANELNTATGFYTVTATSMHMYQNWIKALPLLIDNEPSLDIYSVIEPKKQTLNWTQFKVELPKLLYFEQELRKTSHDQFTDYALSLQPKLHEDLYDALLVMMVTLAHKQSAHASLGVLLPLMKNDVWLVASLEYMVRRLGTTFHSLVRKIFEETLAVRYEKYQLILFNYIFHSLNEKEARDRLEGIRAR